MLKMDWLHRGISHGARSLGRWNGLSVQARTLLRRSRAVRAFRVRFRSPGSRQRAGALGLVFCKVDYELCWRAGDRFFDLLRVRQKKVPAQFGIGFVWFVFLQRAVPIRDMLGALKSVFWPSEAARPTETPALQNLAGDKRKAKLRDVKAEDEQAPPVAGIL
eukprot:s840_g2.t1